MKRLAVEDLRIYNFDCTYARTLADADRLLFGQAWDEVWLDWDMGGIWGSNGIDSRHLVERLAREAAPIGRIVVATQNMEGRAIIQAALAGLYELAIVTGNDYAIGYLA